jgi:hypothetical protein
MSRFFRQFFRGRRRLLLLIALLTALSSATSAQWLDTVNYSLKQRPKFFLNLTTFSSVVSGNVVRFSGFRAGLNYNKRVKFGAGFYGLNTQVVSSILVEDDTGSYATDAELRLDFFSVSAEYIFFHRPPWQFSFIPFQISVGAGYYDYIRSSDKVRTSTPRQSVVLYEPALMGQYSIFRWLGLGASAGYRFRLHASRELKQDLSAPTFSFGLRLFVDELYLMAFPEGLCKKKDKGTP